MRVAADDYGYVHLPRLHKQWRGRIEGVASFLVETAGVDFNDDIVRFDQLQRFFSKNPVPTFVFGKESVLVVHLDFVEVSDDVHLLSF